MKMRAKHARQTLPGLYDMWQDIPLEEGEAA